MYCMKKLNLIIPLVMVFSLVIFSIAAADDNTALTLKEAVMKAVKIHPSIQAEKMVYLAQKEAVSNARSGFFPSIDFSADAGYEDVHNSLTRNRQLSGQDNDNHRGMWYHTQTLSLTQLIYDGSFTKSKYEAQNHRLRAARILAAGSADQIALEVIENYMNILRARKIIRFAKENIVQLKDLRNNTRMRLEKGKGTITDVDRVQLTLSDSKAVLENYQGILQNAGDRFSLLTGANAALITRQTGKIEFPFETVEKALDQAKNKNASLLVARANVFQKESDLKTSKAAYHPKVNLIAQATREENVEGLEDVDTTIAGLVRVKYNLFKGDGDRATIFRNASLLSEARFREKELMLNVEANVRVEFNNMHTAKRQIPFLEEKVGQNIKVLESYEEQFLVNKRDIMDVIEAQKMLFTFQAALENMETEKKLAQFRILTIAGQLFDTLGVEFNPEI